MRRHGETMANVGYRIVTQLKKLSDARRLDQILELAKNKQLPSMLVPIYESKNHYHIVSVKNFVSQENYIYWALGLFHRCATQLKSFNEARINFNAELLAGNANNALDHLNTVDSISISWWAIENKVHILKELNRESVKEYIQNIKDSFPNHDVSSRIKEILLMSESSSIGVFAGILDSQLNEYRASGIQSAIEYGAVISCMQLPISFDPDRRLTLDQLYLYRMESVIDQYILFKTIISEIYLKDGTIDTFLIEKIRQLADFLDDGELKSLVDNSSTSDDQLHPKILKIVDDYTHGAYDNVINSVVDLVNQRSQLPVGLIEIFARSKLYNNDRSEKTLYDHLSNSFASILMLEPNSDERIEYLHKMCVKFRNELWSKSLMFHLSCVLEEIVDSSVIELSRKDTRALGPFNTPKANSQNHTLQVVLDSRADQIPIERTIRHQHDAHSVKDLDRTQFPILSDFLKVQSRQYKNTKSWMKLINFAIDNYFLNKFSFYHLPMNVICREVSDLEKSDNATMISCLIILDIYGKEINGAYDEIKSELFVDLLDANSTHKPTDLFHKNNIDKNEAYYLRNICISSQLDNVGAYKNNDEVIHERVAILDKLILTFPSDSEELKLEKDKVLETLFSDKLRAKIETGKLFVDVQALETHRKQSYKTLFEQAKSIEGGTVLDPINLKEDINRHSADILEITADNSGLPRAVTSNEKTSILYKIFNNTARDFALNENYGLDKYLSAEIRHTVFITQLRACFEKAHLITVEKNGEYLPNIFWDDKYSYLSTPIKDEVDQHFKDFSRNIDTILKKTNNFFRVTVDGFGIDEYIFDFSAYYHRLVEISKLIDAHSNFESFFNALIDFMWELSAEHAKKAQTLINDTLHPQILNEIQLLENNITFTKAGAPMGELMQEIKNCRSNFSKEIELVLNWFRFVGADGANTLEKLAVVVDASVTSFKSIYSHKGAQINFNQPRKELTLNYRESRSLFIALFTAIENAVKYRKSNSIVSIDCYSEENKEIIQITNLIEPETFGDRNEFMTKHRSTWNEKNSNLSREEGGSGLYKIYNLLHNSSSGFSFDINIDDNKFYAVVELNHESFNNRRQPPEERKDI
ncbi:hypothetical protein DBR18_26940 [Pseudomonas sp. HMWF021]|nr:hypothetical protein DBR18_26940 [Pseudomonas sp. HMWF021]